MKALLIICLLALFLGFIVEPVSATDWYEMESGTGAHLQAVWGSSATDVFAVGYYGTILHYDGVSWKKLDSGSQDSLYRAEFHSKFPNYYDDLFTTTRIRPLRNSH